MVLLWKKTCTAYHITIWSTRKNLKAKYNNKELTFRLLRNYSVDAYKQTLKKISFPNYENFGNREIAYSDFINSLDCVLNDIVPLVKNNTSGCFDGEIADTTHMRDKPYNLK